MRSPASMPPATFAPASIRVSPDGPFETAMRRRSASRIMPSAMRCALSLRNAEPSFMSGLPPMALQLPGLRLAPPSGRAGAGAARENGADGIAGNQPGARRLTVGCPCRARRFAGNCATGADA